MRAARFKSSSIIDKAVVDLVSLSAHKWQCNKRSSKSATMPSMHTIYHAYATVPSLRRHIHTSSHSHSHPHPYSYRWKLRSIWMCRCKHMLNWIEIEFAILCAAANAIFFAVREAPSRLPSHSHTLPPPPIALTHSSSFSVFILFTLGRRVAWHGYELGRQKVMPSCHSIW